MSTTKENESRAKRLNTLGIDRAGGDGRVHTADQDLVNDEIFRVLKRLGADKRYGEPFLFIGFLAAQVGVGRRLVCFGLGKPGGGHQTFWSPVEASLSGKYILR